MQIFKNDADHTIENKCKRVASFAFGDLVKDPGLHERVDEAGALSERALAIGQLGQDLLVADQGFGHVESGAVGHVLSGGGLQQVDSHLQDGLEELPNVGVTRPGGDGGVGQVSEDVVEFLVGGLVNGERNLPPLMLTLQINRTASIMTDISFVHIAPTKKNQLAWVLLENHHFTSFLILDKIKLSISNMARKT